MYNVIVILFPVVMFQSWNRAYWFILSKS